MEGEQTTIKIDSHSLVASEDIQFQQPTASKKSKIDSIKNDMAEKAPEDMLTLIESAQKQALWKEVQFLKSQTVHYKELYNKSEETLLSSKRSCAEFKALWSNILSDYSGAELSSSLENIKDIISILKSGIQNASQNEYLDMQGERSELNGALMALEEELLNQKHFILELEDKNARLDRKIRRLEFELMKKGNMQGNDHDRTEERDNNATSKLEQVVEVKDQILLSEIEALKSMSRQHLAELEAMERERSNLKGDLVGLQSKIRKVPEEYFKDPREMQHLMKELRFLKQELERCKDNYFSLDKEILASNNRQDQILKEFDLGKESKSLRIKDSLESVVVESNRLRKERDHMRALYEQANNQVSSLIKQNTDLHISLSKQQTFEDFNQKMASILDVMNYLRSNPSCSPQSPELLKLLEGLQNNDVSLISELETLATAFEDVQKQNTALAKQISTKDDAYNKLLGEKLNSDFNLVQIKKETELSHQKSSALERISLERLEHVEQKEQNLRNQLIETERKLSGALVEVERVNWKVAELSQERMRLNAIIDSHSSENPSEKIAELGKFIDTLHYEKRRILDDLELTHKKLKSYQDTSIGPRKDLEDQLLIYKKLMKCNSCHIHDKNAVITKCMHVFCKQCLDTRIESRQRKCPNCGEAFGATDIRLIYL